MTAPTPGTPAPPAPGTMALPVQGGSTTRRFADGQSLGKGAAGAALLPIERALNGSGDWSTAKTAVRQAVTGAIDGGTHAGLYYGAPAIAFLLQASTADGRQRYHHAARTLNERIDVLVRRRLTVAAARITAGRAAAFAEYDLFHGLTGLGALLLTRRPHTPILGDILNYLVARTRPRKVDDLRRPGWWVDHHPDPLLPTPGGHANLGMAHGAAGVLAMLALAARDGQLVAGQTEAIAGLLDFFERWRQETTDGPWWPQWITRDDLRTGRPGQHRPGRPSWCYGTIGIARAIQLAAIAISDTGQRAVAETALEASLTDAQLDRLTDAGLCHGVAGAYQTAYHAARDAADPAIAQRLPALAHRLTEAAGNTTGEGLLTGAAGVALAVETARRAAPPRSGWDRCLLIT